MLSQNSKMISLLHWSCVLKCKIRFSSLRMLQLCWYLFSDRFGRVRVCFCYMISRCAHSHSLYTVCIAIHVFVCIQCAVYGYALIYFLWCILFEYLNMRAYCCLHHWMCCESFIVCLCVYACIWIRVYVDVVFGQVRLSKPNARVDAYQTLWFSNWLYSHARM